MAFSYMEVAVSALLRRSMVPVVLLASLSGCAGMFTPHEDPKVAGMRLYRQQDYTDAAGSFRNAIRTDPRDYQSHYYLA